MVLLSGTFREHQTASRFILNSTKFAITERYLAGDQWQMSSYGRSFHTSGAMLSRRKGQAEEIMSKGNSMVGRKLTKAKRNVVEDG